MKSGYTGVQFNSLTNMWQARVQYNGHVYECGQYETPRQAAISRDKKIIEKGLPQALQILKLKE